ncbi:hypothetical protein UA08_05006 [Talaromyces atroroseus]|uniref:Uncharacterized protein n=1 Tax=Talaromyces atroroseus TaxID=1441469 RepID=A0A225APZ2_TALAT|nr:hypothetical protein UA08_05006 [Talaromyces atroroseus]OKL59328.1 hypothetical protein UA08_05006 [Talaromyces atroroseus]
MTLTRILIDSASHQLVQDEVYYSLFTHARDIQFDEMLAFNLNALLTLEPPLLQEKLASVQRLVPKNTTINCDFGLKTQPSGIQFQSTTPFSSRHQDTIRDGTLSNDIHSAQNIPSVEADPNTNNTDYHMEQVDAQDSENSPWSTVDTMPDLAHMGDDQTLDSYLDFQGFDCSTAIGNTDHDRQSCSSLAASTLIGQSSLTVSSRESYSPSHNMGECMPADNHLRDAPGMESYPTPVSNPSYTPKSANRALTKPRKTTRAGGNRPASTLAVSTGVDLSPLSEADSVRLGLLRSLILKSHEVDPKRGTRRSFNDEDLREIYRLGDRIINETARVLNDWSEWSSREFQPPNAVLSPCHDLSPVEICAVAFRFLMETHNGIHRKSIHRRLAQILLDNFVAEVEQEITTREGQGVFIRYDGGTGRKSVTVAHDLTIAKVGISEKNGKKCNREEIGKEKSPGRRWWRLGSGIGVVTVLTCPSDFNTLISFSDDSLKLLVSYVRHAYPNAVAHFQSLDPVIQALFANTSLIINASAGLDPLYSRFNPISEEVRWFDTIEAMAASTRQLLRIFRQN